MCLCPYTKLRYDDRNKRLTAKVPAICEVELGFDLYEVNIIGRLESKFKGLKEPAVFTIGVGYCDKLSTCFLFQVSD